MNFQSQVSQERRATAVTSKGPKRLILILLAIAVSVTLYLVHRKTQERLPIQVAYVQRGELIATESTNAIVEPKNAFQVVAPFATTVKATHVREGQVVPQGAVLITLDDTEARLKVATALTVLRTADANYDSVLNGGNQQERTRLAEELKRLETEQEEAAHHLSTLKHLQFQGASSQNEIGAAQQHLSQIIASRRALEQRRKAPYAVVDIRRTRAALEEAQAAYTSTRRLLDQTVIRAAFKGTIFDLPVKAGQFVQRGDKLVEMADLAMLQVKAYFDEPELGILRIGLPVTITWEGRLGTFWHGHVIQLPANIITYMSRHVGTPIISVDDPNSGLLPNMNVLVSVTTERLEKVLKIPHEALQYSDHAGYFVFVVSGDRLRRTPVKVRISNPREVQVTEGLTEGQPVAISMPNYGSLTDDQAVRVANPYFRQP